MAKNIKTKQGFTIIEVVLVLAIAGLIFLMVFVALPQLQRSQRDTQRRQDLSRVVTALVQYQTNNRTKRNNLPGEGTAYFADQEDVTIGACSELDKTACNFIKNYMNAAGSGNDAVNAFTDPDGVPYNLVITENYATVKDSLTTVKISEIGDASQLKLTDDATLTDGKGYTIAGENPFPEHVIYIVPGGKCEGEYVVKDQLRHFAILYKLEGAGTYCVGSDNN